MWCVFEGEMQIPAAAPPKEVPTKPGRHSVGTDIPKLFWTLTSASSTCSVYPYCHVVYREKQQQKKKGAAGVVLLCRAAEGYKQP